MPRTKTRLPAADAPAVSSEPVESPPINANARVGTVVDDRYRIVGVIGVGGMGIVYRAEHVYIRRTVALKILDHAMAQHSQLFERFEREALAIGRLDHPNCVSVLDFGHLPDGSCYLTMPYLEGPTLGDRLIDGPLPVRRALRIARHVASALAHIHKAGIVHRDVKPENIVIVDREGDPDFATLLDFGIAKLLPREERAKERNDLTIAGQRFGTPAYMSPEQAVGGAVDHRADVYALCVTLYEMLCGARPFDDADPVRIMEMQERSPVPPMAQFGAGAIPDAVESLVRRGLAKRATDRYTDAVSLIAAIDACLEVRAPDPRSRGARPFYRRPRILAALAAAVVGIAAAVWLMWPSAPGESHAAAHARSLIAQGKPTQAIAYLEGNPELADHADAHLQLAHAYAASGRHRDAIASYRRALSHDRGLARDADLVSNLRLAMDVDDVEVVAAAAELLIVDVRDETTRERVVRMAGEHDELVWRARMREVAEQSGLSEQIDWRASYTLDLEQAATCEQRRDSTARLRSLGDPDAISALGRARDRPDNDCLREVASEAITFLRTRKAAAGPTGEGLDD